MSLAERNTRRETEEHSFPIEHSEGEPRSNIAVLFPGQAIQEVGMGKSFRDNPAAAEVFDRADASLERVFGRKITPVMFNGPENELLKTSRTQPAVLTYSVALHNANRQRGEKGYATLPSFVTGHSMGTITAAVLSGALDFEEGLRLAAERGRLMEEKGSRVATGMITTVNGNEEVVREILASNPDLDLCLVNSDSRFVIGGPQDALAATQEALKKARIKTVVVPTDRAMHSRYVTDAKPAFEQVLAQTDIGDPQLPIIGSNGQVLSTAEQIIEDQLAQFDSTFDFRKIKSFFDKANVRLVSEVNEKGTFAKIIAATLGGVAVAAATGIGIYEWHKHHPGDHQQ